MDRESFVIYAIWAWLLFALIFVVCSPVPATQPDICVVSSHEGNGVVGHGTGCVIARDARATYVLTAAHVLRPYRFVTVQYPFARNVSRRPHTARILFADPTTDVGLVETLLTTITPRPIRRTPFVPGESIAMVGLGSRWNVNWGPFRRLFGRRDAMVGFTPRQGDSGAPLVDRQGYIVGLVTGYEDSTRACFGPTASTILQQLTSRGFAQ